MAIRIELNRARLHPLMGLPTMMGARTERRIASDNIKEVCFYPYGILWSALYAREREIVDGRDDSTQSHSHYLSILFGSLFSFCMHPNISFITIFIFIYLFFYCYYYYYYYWYQQNVRDSVPICSWSRDYSDFLPMKESNE